MEMKMLSIIIIGAVALFLGVIAFLMLSGSPQLQQMLTEEDNLIGVSSLDLQGSAGTTTPTASRSVIYPNWQITKTGNEVLLDVKVRQINRTAIEVTIISNDSYTNSYKLTASDVRDFPVTNQVPSLSTKLSTSSLDMKGNQTKKIIVNYQKESEVSLKLGWNSVEITGDGGGTNEWANSDNGCKTSTNKLYAAYIDAGNDIHFGDSRDNGFDWVDIQAASSTADDGHGIVCGSDLMPYIYFEDGGSVKIINSSNLGDTWTSPTTIGSGGVPSCVIDGNDIIHCAIITGSDTAIYYNNSGGSWNSETINGNTNDDSDACDIEVNESNSPFVVCTGSDQDDMDMWSPSLNGWGDGNRTEIHAGIITDPLSGGFGMDFGIEGNNFHLVFIDQQDLWYCNGTLTSPSDASCQEVDSSTSFWPTMGISPAGEVEIIYGSGTGASNPIYRANSSDGVTFTTRTQIGSEVGILPSIFDSTFPVSNRMDNVVRFTWMDSGNDAVFSKYNIGSDTNLPIGYNLVGDPKGFGTLEGVDYTATPSNSNAILSIRHQDATYFSGTNINITINFTDSYTFNEIELFGYTTFAFNNTAIWVSDDFSTWTKVWNGTLWTDDAPDYDYKVVNFSEQTKRYVIIEADSVDGSYIGTKQIVIRNATINLVNLTSTIVTSTDSESGINKTKDGFVGYIGGEWQVTGGENITFNFGEAKVTNNIEFFGYPTSGFGLTPEDITLYNSTDGSTWTEIGYFRLPDYVAQGPRPYTNYTLSNTQYIKVELGNCYDLANCYMYEIRMWEDALAGGPAPVDPVYPNFSEYYDNNASLIDSGTGLFNVTVENTNGTVWIEIDGSNYSMSNLTAEVYNASISLSGAGVYPYEYHSWGSNTSENYNSSGVRSYTINASSEAIPPNVTINEPSPPATYTTTTINFNITALDETAVDTCLYSLTVGETETNYSMSQSGDEFTATNTSMVQGTITVSYFCNDTLGNLNNTETIAIYIDSIKPDIEIVFPTNNTNTTNTGIDVNYTRYDGDIDSCWYSNDSMGVNTTLASCGNLTSKTWSEGLHNVTIWINDTLNNQNSSSISFRVDTTPPTFSNLENQELLEGVSLNYDINAADTGVGVESFDINWSSTFSIVAGTGVLTNTSGLSVGKYYINVSVNDTLGNLESSVIVVNVTAANQITDCQTISTPGTYTQANDIIPDSEATCIYITANDVTYEGNGYSIVNATWTGSYGMRITGDNVLINNVDLNFNDQDNIQAVRFENAWDGTLQNSMINSTDYWIIFSTSGGNITINNNTFHNASNYGVYASVNINNIKFHNNLFDNSSQRLMFFTTNVFNNSELINNTFLHADVYQISLNDVNNVTIKNNTFKLPNLGSRTLSIGGDVSDTRIESNRFYNARRLNFEGDTSNLVFYNNTEENTTESGGGTMWNFLGTNTNLNISNNSFIDNHLTGGSQISIESGSLINVDYNVFKAVNDLDTGAYYNIWINNASNTTIRGNFINGSGIGHGIMVGGNGNRPKNITAYNNEVHDTLFGMLFHAGTTESTYYNNNITDSRIGLYFLVNAQNNTAYDMNFDGCNSSISFYSDSSYATPGNPSNNTVYNMFINNSVKEGIDFFNATGALPNIISNSTILNSGENDIEATVVSGGNILINVSYDSAKDNVDATSDFTRKWFYRAYVNDSDGNVITGANVTAFNRSDDVAFNLTTDGSGWTEVFEIIDYVNDGGTQAFYSNYNISANNVSDIDSHLFNASLTTNKFNDVFTLNTTVGADTVYPTFSGYYDNNGSLIDSGTGLFNVTVSDSNGTVWLEIDGSNYSASNEAGDVYNVSVSMSGAGDYTYRWHSWGNGTDENYNKSLDRSYTINASADTTNPNITIASPSNTTIAATSVTFTVNSDENLDFCLYTLLNWDFNYTMNEVTPTQFSHTNTSITNGGYRVQFWCNDTSGNINNTESVDFSMTEPTIVVTGLSTDDMILSYNVENYATNNLEAMNLNYGI